MEILLSVFKLLAGIGLFLFAMFLLEESLKNLSGRKFKLFLQRVTKNRISAVAGGAVVTAVLQSSSMVSLMVLAFVGAGVFTMKNAFAIILGANLGTTIDSWLVATLGFKMDIEVVAYPAVFVGGLLLILFGKRPLVKHISWFLFGFGMLFIALSFMKTAMEAQVETFNFSRYADTSLLVFLLIGFLLTMLVQSSSVTMALTLSAIHAGAIEFAPATAIVLGSELGTTIKILLGSVGGTASKKRVALGSFMFNLFMTVIAFSFLKLILYLITDILHIGDPLIGLVTFSSLINLFSVLVFLPFLDPFAKLLERFFKDTDGSTAAFISHANVSEPETALDLFRMEVAYFLHNSLLFNSELMEIDTSVLREDPEFKEANDKRKFHSKTLDEKYEFLNQLQGELQAFYLGLRDKLQDKSIAQLNQWNTAVRSAMHGVKSMHDIGPNITNLKQSSKDIKFDFVTHHQKETQDIYARLNTFLHKAEEASFEKVQELYDEIQENFSSSLHEFYKNAPKAHIEDMDITTVLNFNRELFTSNKAMLISVKDLLLDEKQAKDFNEVPVYQT